MFSLVFCFFLPVASLFVLCFCVFGVFSLVCFELLSVAV